MTATSNNPEVSVEEPNPSREYATGGNGVARKYATAEELLEAAPKDIREQDVNDVFGGKCVKVRGLTAAQSAHVRQLSFTVRGGQRVPELAFAQMEIAQFELGVVEPKLSHDQVLMLHRTAGPSFTRVIEVLDELSGIGKEELRKAQKDFQES
jgi:hypothetical protein